MALYRWDLDGLLAALSIELDRPGDYYTPPIKKLLDRLQAEYDSAYRNNDR